MNKIKYIIALLALSFFASCITHSGKKNLSENSTTDTLSYEMKNIYRDTITKSDDGLDTTSISIVYPFFDEKDKLGKMLNDTVLRRISFWGEAAKQYSIQQYANQFIKDYKEYASQGLGFPAFPWYVQTSIQVANNNSNILSLKLINESYTGGAHGSHYVLFDNYDKRTNKMIKLDEILKDKQDKDLLKIGEYYFKVAREIPVKQSLQENGVFEAAWLDENQKAGFYFNDNFTITKDTLTFYYNEYDVACYAFGPTELKIPLEKIRPYLKNSYGF